MASTSTKEAATKPILQPVTTLKGHREYIRSISYFPDGQRIISGSEDKTVRQWDLKAGKEIEEARGVCEEKIWAVAVSKDGRWVVTGGGDYETGELKVCEVETGIVKTFQGHSRWIGCIDISADSMLLASGADDSTARIWNLGTGKLVAGPFKSVGWVGAVRLSTDSKKLAVNSNTGKCLEVWDVQKQKLDVRISGIGITLLAPVFWTNKARILAAFTFTDDDAKTIYEFDASTLETVGAPFEGHTDAVTGLALSSDGALLASASYDDDTIKLWAFVSRQLLVSFDVQNPRILILSPNSRELAYTTSTKDDYKIYTCNTPPDVLAQASTSARKKSTLSDLLNSDATRRSSAGHRKPQISAIPMVQRPLPTRDPQQPIFLRLRKLLPFSAARTNTIPQYVQPRNPLDVPATSPLPHPLSGQAATQFDHFEMGSSPPPSNVVPRFLRHHLPFLVPRHSHGPPVIEVAAGRKFNRLVAANLPEYRKADDTRYPSGQRDIESSDIDSLPDVHWCKAFLCYYSCWSHGRLRSPPRWRLERVAIHSQDSTANGSPGGAHGRS